MDSCQTNYFFVVAPTEYTLPVWYHTYEIFFLCLGQYFALNVYQSAFFIYCKTIYSQLWVRLSDKEAASDVTLC